MLLLIPGPVMTDPRVRAAAAQDYAPWDMSFRERIGRVRERMLRLAGGQPGEHTALMLPGSGHFAIEAAIRTLVPHDGGVLVPDTGEYAQRFARLATEAGRRVTIMPVPDMTLVSPAAVSRALAADGTLTHLVVVYSETSSGMIHDAAALARAAGEAGRRVLIDAVSALGALPLDLADLPMVDCLTVTANKCLEGLPGLSVSVARIDRLLAGAGRAGSWSLDLADLYSHTLRVGDSHRFTPAAQAIAALDVALDLYEAEGRAARLGRYAANRDALRDGLRLHGMEPLLPDALQGPIVMNVAAPAQPWWDLQMFVDALKARGVLISNFSRDSGPAHFRVGCIGAITPSDMTRAAAAMAAAADDIRNAARKAA